MVQPSCVVELEFTSSMRFLQPFLVRSSQGMPQGAGVLPTIDEEGDSMWEKLYGFANKKAGGEGRLAEKREVRKGWVKATSPLIRSPFFCDQK
jgi:hypothetical protein